MMIISARKLIKKMARKWQKVAALKRKRLSFPTKIDDEEVGKKGHFMAYTTDKVGFALPIAYLNSSFVFRELLTMSEEEFGVPSDGPIILPCDSQFMGYVTSLIRKKAPKDVEEALLLSIRCSINSSSSSSSSSSSYNVHQQQPNQFMLLSSC